MKERGRIIEGQNWRHEVIYAFADKLLVMLMSICPKELKQILEKDELMRYKDWKDYFRLCSVSPVEKKLIKEDSLRWLVGNLICDLLLFKIRILKEL